MRPTQHLVPIAHDPSEETTLLLDCDRKMIILPQADGTALEVPVYDFAAAAITVQEHQPCRHCRTGAIDYIDPTQVPIKVICGTCGTYHSVIYDKSMPAIRPEACLPC